VADEVSERDAQGRVIVILPLQKPSVEKPDVEKSPVEKADVEKPPV
jgi:hypothetical protein